MVMAIAALGRKDGDEECSKKEGAEVEQEEVVGAAEEKH